LVVPLALRRHVPIVENEDRMAAVLSAASLEWTALRLPDIVRGAVTTRIRTSTDGTGLGLRLTTGLAVTTCSTLPNARGRAAHTLA
jgi:hypothetical protein